MSQIEQALKKLDNNLRQQKKNIVISFKEYLTALNERPEVLLRDIFQLVHDMVNFYVPKGVDEYPHDPESVHFVNYDFQRLFVKGSNNPFFADRLFSNRFMDLIDSFNYVPDWHKIYFFEGPPGSGKSTFLSNFLYRFERYTTTDEGEYFETNWIINNAKLNPQQDILYLLGSKMTEGIIQQNQQNQQDQKQNQSKQLGLMNSKILIPCPNHDHPILQIPKDYRKDLLMDIIQDEEFKTKLLNDKKYRWFFKAEPCTICSSLFKILSEKLNSPLEALNSIYPKRMYFDRRLGDGISVYNPGDNFKSDPIKNPALQQSIDNLFGDSNVVKYIHSDIAKTNNGIYVIMDIKNKNKNRLMNLHGIVSDGIHKVETIEENIKTFFIGLINPQDKEIIENTKSLKDRCVYIKIPYILDYQTEVNIYMNNFGENIKNHFLPNVLRNFAKVIIATRLSSQSPGLREWIGNPGKYSQYCDPDLLLLKMEIYAGRIPDWIAEDDRKTFKADVRKKVLREAEAEGYKGFTGRQANSIFYNFYSTYINKGRLINMEMIKEYFTRTRKDYGEMIPSKFLDSLINSYDFAVLQQVKECLYSYNKSQLVNNILNYIFAVNFDIGSKERCKFTHQLLEITEGFFKSIEDFLIGKSSDNKKRQDFRKEVMERYISQAIFEMKSERKTIKRTKLYADLYNRYVRYLKSNALDPFIENENFRSAIKEYQTKEYNSHDKKIKNDVNFLIKNLIKKYKYTENSAQEVCIYVIDNDLVNKFKQDN